MPGIFCNEAGERCFYDHELNFAIQRAFDDRFALYGASASNDLYRPTTGFQFAQNVCRESSLVLVLLERDFKMGGAMAHGLKPIAHKRVSVDELAVTGLECDYVVTKLDGKPAAQRLRELITENRLHASAPYIGARRDGARASSGPLGRPV